MRGTFVMAVMAAILMLAVSVADAQSAAPSSPSPALPAIVWSVEVGYESLWLRDVARTTRPVDASPVSWEGDGPAIAARYDRANPKRLHRFEFSFSSTGHFVYDAVVRTIPRSPDDHATRVGGRYEYRRYPFRDLWIDGLDIGIGVQGLGEHLSLARHFDPSIEIDRSENRLGTAVVAAARFRRWQWLDVEVAWANGMLINRTHASHSADAEASYDQWGGGWLTDLAIVATVPVSRQVGIQASLLRSAQGLYASHDHASSGRSRLLAGVTYGR